jgi:hypothetical protein
MVHARSLHATLYSPGEQTDTSQREHHGKSDAGKLAPNSHFGGRISNGIMALIVLPVRKKNEFSTVAIDTGAGSKIDVAVARDVAVAVDVTLGVDATETFTPREKMDQIIGLALVVSLRMYAGCEAPIGTCPCAWCSIYPPKMYIYPEREAMAWKDRASWGGPEPWLVSFDQYGCSVDTCRT